MVIQVRVDDRLIHGQVALVWSKELNTSGIIVANDEAAKNDTVKMTLQMATPAGIKLLVKSVDDAARLFNDPRGTNMRLFALTRNIHDALVLEQKAGANIQTINVANCGRFDTSPNRYAPAGDTMFLNEQEVKDAMELVKLKGNNFYHQLIPTNAKTPMSELLKGANASKK
jgi:PTS system mannose-specific IIB component